jgi:sigma-B regulation protein RsbU (phosphoserine phosphatase)
MPVKRPNGEIAGVTGVVLPIGRLLEQRLLVHNIPPETRSFMVYLAKVKESDEREVRILARNEYTNVQHRTWRTHLRTDVLTSSDAKEFKAVIDDFATGTSNMRRMPYEGRDSLWVYGPIQEKAFLVLITPYEEILGLAAEGKKYVGSLISNMVRIMGLVLLVIILVVVVLAFAFSRTVTKPLQALVEGGRRLGEGDFDAQVDIQSRDEFGHVGQVFNSLGPRLKENYRFRQALAVAMEVQQNLLPKADPEIEGLDVAGITFYCDETGGDYYDFLDILEVNRGKIGVVVGDVSDHGLPSALLMATARGLLRQRVSMSGSIASIISDVNRQLNQDVDGTGRFMTLFYAEIDTHGKFLRWVRAGHDPAIVYDTSTDRFEELVGEGVPLGMLPDYTFEESQHELKEGQVIVIATDGIWEATNTEGEMFGKDTLREIIRAHARAPAREILMTITNAVEQFRHPLTQEDDVTLMVIKVVG